MNQYMHVVTKPHRRLSPHKICVGPFWGYSDYNNNNNFINSLLNLTAVKLIINSTLTVVVVSYNAQVESQLDA